MTQAWCDPSNWPTPDHHTIAVHVDSYDTFVAVVGLLKDLVVRVETDPAMPLGDPIDPAAKYEIGQVIGHRSLHLTRLNDDTEPQGSAVTDLAIVTKITVL